MQDILDEEHMQQYVKPTIHTREAPHAPANSAPFQVRGAPWQGAGADFPSLAPAKPAAVASAWGKGVKP